MTSSTLELLLCSALTRYQFYSFIPYLQLISPLAYIAFSLLHTEQSAFLCRNGSTSNHLGIGLQSLYELEQMITTRTESQE